MLYTPLKSLSGTGSIITHPVIACSCFLFHRRNKTMSDSTNRNEVNKDNKTDIDVNSQIKKEEPVKKAVVNLTQKRETNLCLCKAQIKRAGNERYLVMNIFSNSDRMVCSTSIDMFSGKDKNVVYMLSAFYLLDKITKFVKKSHYKIICQSFFSSDNDEDWNFIVKPKIMRILIDLFIPHKKLLKDKNTA